MMKKNGMNGKNRWIRTTALAVAAVLAFSGTANTFAQAMDTDAIAGAYRAALPVVSVAAVDRSMKLAEKALEEMERRTPEEEQELQRIKNALEDFYIPEGETFSESKTDKEFSETSNEAQSLMGNGINFDK